MRQPLQRLALYTFQVLVTRPVLRWVVGVRYRGLGRLPDGPCLVVSNHNSHLDAAVLMSMFPLRRLAHVHPVAAADYFGSNWFMSMLAMMLMNGIPIERTAARGKDPLALIAEKLKAGETLIFFPEGSRGEAGVVARFRAGVGRLVQQVPGLLVIPVFLSGPERIWPRGEMVPVPLSIDANIGRPRTFSDRGDPREVADQVREAVLGLAPPPPPVPGAKPAPPTRVAISSIDSESRKELFRAITRRLGRLERTLGVSDPMLEADGEGLREASGPVPVGRERAWLRLLAGIFRTRGRFRGPRFVEAVERSRVNEALSLGRDTGFVVEDGCVLVDLMALGLDEPEAARERDLRNHLQYLAADKKIPLRAWWRYARKAPSAFLISTFGLTRPPVPELLVHLTFPSSLVAQRLRSGGAALGPHQREAALERQQQAYREAGDVLRKRRRVEVLELDGSRMGPEEAADRVEARCRELFQASRTAKHGS